jgi:hypothetical protein
MLPAICRNAPRFIRYSSTLSNNYGRTRLISDPKISQFIIGTDNGFLPRQVERYFVDFLFNM